MTRYQKLRLKLETMKVASLPLLLGALSKDLAEQDRAFIEMVADEMVDALKSIRDEIDAD